MLKFKTDENSKLKNKSIKIQFVYDFDSELNDKKIDTVLDKKSILKIPYQNIPHLDKLASIRFEYIFDNGEKRYGYITENQTINRRTKELPNQITITLIENPKKEIVYRITKALYFDNKLKIISTEKTDSIFDIYFDRLTFKDSYEVSDF